MLDFSRASAASRRVVPPEAPRPAKQIALASRASARKAPRAARGG